MSRPIKKQSISAATAAEAGSPFSAKGHVFLGMFVHVNGTLDTANDTVDIQLEVEGPDGEWSAILNEAGTKVGVLAAGDFDANNNAYIYISGVPADQIRANLTTLTDAAGSDLTSVDAYVLANGNAGSRGHSMET